MLIQPKHSEFIEISSTQNYNQGKTFNGVLRVEDSLQTFALTGMLLDSNGDPIENAVIEVHSKVRTGITDENGIFGIAVLASSASHPFSSGFYLFSSA